MIHVFEYMDEKRSSWYLCDLLIKKRIPKRYKDESKFFLCNYSTSIPPYLVENMIMNTVHEGDWPWLTLNNCEYSKYPLSLEQQHQFESTNKPEKWGL